jgi:hypothetical protein
MKKVWHLLQKNWQIQNIGVALSKKEFPGLFKKIWNKMALFENAAHGFRKPCLFQLIVNGIETCKLAPSQSRKSTSCRQWERRYNII